MSITGLPKFANSFPLPLLYCTCQKRRSSDFLIKKFCIEPACQENNVFGEKCPCQQRHMTDHPESVFE